MYNGKQWHTNVKSESKLHEIIKSRILLSINQFIRQVWQHKKYNKQWWQDNKAVNCTNSCPQRNTSKIKLLQSWLMVQRTIKYQIPKKTTTWQTHKIEKNYIHYTDKWEMTSSDWLIHKRLPYTLFNIMRWRLHRPNTGTPHYTDRLCSDRRYSDSPCTVWTSCGWLQLNRPTGSTDW